MANHPITGSQIQNEPLMQNARPAEYDRTRAGRPADRGRWSTRNAADVYRRVAGHDVRAARRRGPSPEEQARRGPQCPDAQCQR